MKKKIVSLALVASMLLSAGCTAKSPAPAAAPTPAAPAPAAATAAPAPAPASAAPAAKGEVALTFWHAMGGKGGEAINVMVTDFNAKNAGKIKVTAVYQGSYDDALTKLKSSQMGSFEADIVQVYDIGSRLMIDSKWVVPVADLSAKDTSWKADFVPAIANYYTIDNKMYSMPFNTSTPLMYYNKTKFKEAGLDPENAPKTMEELITVSKTLLDKNPAKPPIGIPHYGWFFEQFLCKQMLPYVDAGNGREGVAKKTVFKENGAGLKTFAAWNSLYTNGVAINLGRETKDTKAAFIAGDVAITFESTAAIADLVTSVGDKFEVGTSAFPGLAGSTGGVSIGGGSLWALQNKDTSKQPAVWEFLKYISQPEVQAKWAMGTGYFPTVKGAYENADFKAYIEKHAQMRPSIKQLNESPIESRGAMFTVFPQSRKIIETELEKMILKQVTPEQAVDNATKAIDTAIEDYNLVNN